MNLPVISVIVPVYKVEKYLPACIGSVLKQSFSDFELLLVDDGSPDSCGQLCEEWAGKDSRIRVFHKENGGLSDARNFGLERARGEWLAFVDSDDFIAPDYLKVLFDMTTAAEQPLITVLQSKNISEQEVDYTEGADLSTFFLRKGAPAVRYFSRGQALHAICYNRELTNSAWGKLYHKSLFETIRFPKGRIYEDLGTFYLLADQSPCTAVSSYTGYGYLQRSGSILHQSFSRKQFDLLYFAEQQVSYYAGHAPELLPCAQVRAACAAFDLILMGDPKDPAFRQEFSHTWQVVKRYRGKCLKDPETGFDYRCLSFVSFFGPSFTKAVWNLWLRIKGR